MFPFLLPMKSLRIIPVLLLVLIATAITSALSTRHSFPVQAAVQMLLGIVSFSIGRRSATVGNCHGRSMRTILCVLLLVVGGYSAGGFLSPVGDPYSFQVFSGLEVLYAGIFFWLGRKKERWQEPNPPSREEERNQ